MMSTIDLGVILIYFVLISLYAIYVSFKETRSSKDYFLAGKKLSWVLIGMSLFGSNICATNMVGLAGSAYTMGMGIGNYEWTAIICLVLLGVIFMPVYLKAGITTLPEYLEKRYGVSSRIFLAFVQIFISIVLLIPVALYAGSLIFYQLLGWPIWIGVAVLLLIAGTYTVLGGLNVVVKTDLIQSSILIITSVILLIIALTHVGGFNVLSTVSPDKFKMVFPASDPNLPWPGMFIGITFVGIYYFCNNQIIVQRALGAKSLKDARWGVLLCGFLKIASVFLWVLPGIIAGVLFPNLPKPDLAYPYLMTTLLPPGLLGLAVCALLSAFMSTIDSTLNSTSTIIVNDLYKRFINPEAADKTILRMARIATIGVMILSILNVFLVSRSEHLFIYIQEIASVITIPIVAVFVIGVFWKRATSTGAISTLLMGSCIALLAWAGFIPELSELHFLNRAIVMFFLCSLLFIGISTITPRPPAEKYEDLIYRRDLSTELSQYSEVPLCADYRLWSIILLFLLGILWYIFK